MFEQKNEAKLDEHIELLLNRLGLLHQRIKDSPSIETHNNTPEEERARLLARIDYFRQKAPTIAAIAKNELTKSQKADDLRAALESLQKIDAIFCEIRNEIQKMVEDQYESRLELVKQDIFQAIDIVYEMFDFLVPNVKYEMLVMEKYYRVPSNAAKSILPEMNALVKALNEHTITLREFLDGYGAGEKRTPGYNELRCRNKMFSPYQYYEPPPESYKDMNTCVYEVDKAIEPFLSEKRSDPEFGKLFEQLREVKKPMARMSEIFEKSLLLNTLIKKVGKKYSYRDEYLKTKTLVDQFFALQKKYVSYFHEQLERTENVVAAQFTQEAEKKRFKAIMDEMKRYLAERQLSFAKLETIFSKLFKKDFNIVIQEKAADDITVTITPHHEKEYSRDLLERINIIILEIDFWYAAEQKQLLFQDIGKITEKIQADEPVDKKEFFKMMQTYDAEMEQKVRAAYPDMIKELKAVYSIFSKTFSEKLQQERLEKRLANSKIWEEINPKMEEIKRTLLVLSAENPALKSNVNKFPFIKIACEQTCQILYDLSMQLFILYDGIDGRSIIRMTDILSIYNDCHEVTALWTVFSNYFKKGAMSNLELNEKMVLTYGKNSSTKTALEAVFSKQE